MGQLEFSKDACFNPTLVRLRRPYGPVLRSARGSFQSHAGSIEAEFNPPRIPYTLPVSIPPWFD